MVTFKQVTASEVIEFRESLGLSQADFGKLIGIPPGTIARWERNEGTKTLNFPSSAWIHTCMRNQKIVKIQKAWTEYQLAVKEASQLDEL